MPDGVGINSLLSRFLACVYNTEMKLWGYQAHNYARIKIVALEDPECKIPPRVPRVGAVTRELVRN